MEPYAEVLTAGGHTNSLGRSGEVLAELAADPTRLDELYACISDDDAWVRMRAVDTFEKLVRDDPGLARPYVDDVVGRLTRSEQPSVQWHVAQLFAVVDLTAAQREDAVAWLRERVATTDVDWIVATQCLATLVGFAEAGLVAAADVARLAEVQEGHRSASVRRKAAGFRERLELL